MGVSRDSCVKFTISNLSDEVTVTSIPVHPQVHLPFQYIYQNYRICYAYKLHLVIMIHLPKLLYCCFYVFQKPEMGTRASRRCNELLLDQEDVASFAEGEEVTLLRYAIIEHYSL